MTRDDLLGLGWISPMDVHNTYPRISVGEARKMFKIIRKEIVDGGGYLPYGTKLIVPAKRFLKRYDL